MPLRLSKRLWVFLGAGILLLLAVFLCFQQGMAPVSLSQTRQATEGRLDLRGLQPNKCVAVSGQWLYTPADGSAPVYYDPENPGGMQQDNSGVMNLSMDISVDPAQDWTQMYIPYATRVSRVLIGGQVLYDKQENGAGQVPAYFLLHTPGDSFQLTLITDNAAYTGGGFYRQVLMGGPGAVERYVTLRSVAYVVFVTLLACMAALLLSFYLAVRQYAHLLFLGVAVLFFGAELLITGDGPVFDVISRVLPAHVTMFISVTVQLLSMGFLTAYFYFNLSRKKSLRFWLFIGVAALGAALSVAACFWNGISPPSPLIFSRPTSLWLLAGMLYMSGRDYTRYRDAARIDFFCATLLALCNLLDLAANGLYYQPHFLIAGTAVFCLMAIYAKLREYNVSMKRLQAITDSLEREVARRTGQLTEANRQLEQEVEDRVQAANALRILSTTDHLTGVYNRMRAQNTLDDLISQFTRYGSVFSVIMLDINHFKPFNDNYGHDMGDQVLIAVAGSFRAQGVLRRADLPCRWGGDEFLIILPSSDLRAAYTVAERLRKTVAALELPKGLRVTISLGIAEARQGDDSGSLVKRADDGLYFAKRSGRNRVWPKV